MLYIAPSCSWEKGVWIDFHWFLLVSEYIGFYEWGSWAVNCTLYYLSIDCIFFVLSLLLTTSTLVGMCSTWNFASTLKMAVQYQKFTHANLISWTSRNIIKHSEQLPVSPLFASSSKHAKTTRAPKENPMSVTGLPSSTISVRETTISTHEKILLGFCHRHISSWFHCLISHSLSYLHILVVISQFLQSCSA